jgi:hypothetical protein
MRRALAAAAVASVALAGCGGGSSQPKDTRTTTTKVQVVQAAGDAQGVRFDPAGIYKREAPGVVTVISVFGSSGGGLGGVLGGGDGGGGGSGLGSGFVLDGRVIGLNQQIQTQSGGGEGVGFAVPIDLAKRSVAQLRAKGRVDYAYIGVSSQSVYPQLAQHFGLPTDRGAWLQDVTPGGPADKAGLRGGSSSEQRFQASSFLRGGDVVVGVDGRPVRDANDLGDLVAAKAPGDKVSVELYRGGAKKTIEVTLGKRPLSAGSR